MEATRKLLYERVLTVVWLLAASAFLLVQLGYSFEGNDQVQYLLLPYREMYRDFLPGDWFTWSTSHYHVTFSWIVRALHALSGEDRFRFAMLGAHIASLAWLAYAVLRLARCLTGPARESSDVATAAASRARGGMFEATFALLVFGCAREKGIGEALLNHGCLLPSDLALAPFLLACAACLDRRAIATGVWLGIAGFLHANFAVLGPVVVLPVAFALAWPELRGGAIERGHAVRALAITTGLCLLLELPTLIVLASSFVAKDSDPAAVAITLFVRSPHHYDLAYMLAQEFWWVGLVGLLAVPAFVGPYTLPRRAAAFWLCGVLVGLIGIGLVGAGLHVVSLTRLFTLRMSIPLIAIALIAFAGVARKIVVTGRTGVASGAPEGAGRMRAVIGAREPGALVWVLAALSVLCMFVREDLLALAPFRSPAHVPDASAPGVPGWLIVAVVVPLGCATLALVALRVRRNVAIGVLALVPLVMCLWVARIPLGQTWTGARVREARSFHFADRRIAWDPPDRELYVKTRELTPPDARILIPPGLFEYRMRARRSVFVDWKCAPMKGDEASEWKRRMLSAMGAAEFPSRGYSLPQRSDALYYGRPVSELLDLARREGMTYVLVKKPQLRRAMGGASIVFTSGPYAMLKL